MKTPVKARFRADRWWPGRGRGPPAWAAPAAARCPEGGLAGRPPPPRTPADGSPTRRSPRPGGEPAGVRAGTHRSPGAAGDRHRDRGPRSIPRRQAAGPRDHRDGSGCLRRPAPGRPGSWPAPAPGEPPRSPVPRVNLVERPIPAQAEVDDQALLAGPALFLPVAQRRLQRQGQRAPGAEVAPVLVVTHVRAAIGHRQIVLDVDAPQSQERVLARHVGDHPPHHVAVLVGVGDGAPVGVHRRVQHRDQHPTDHRARPPHDIGLGQKRRLQGGTGIARRSHRILAGARAGRHQRAVALDHHPLQGIELRLVIRAPPVVATGLASIQQQRLLDPARHPGAGLHPRGQAHDGLAGGARPGRGGQRRHRPGGGRIGGVILGDRPRPGATHDGDHPGEGWGPGQQDRSGQHDEFLSRWRGGQGTITRKLAAALPPGRSSSSRWAWRSA